MSKESGDELPPDWRLTTALALMFIGGASGLLAVLVHLSVAALSVAVFLFVAGGISASVLAYRGERAGGISVLRAIGRALKTFFGWIFSLP